MKITKRQLRKIIREEKSRLLTEQLEPAVQANKMLDAWMTQLETKLYREYPAEEVDEFAVEAMSIVGEVERLLMKLITGGYREDY